MSDCSGELHSEDSAIQWTETHCTSDMLDCDLRLIERYSRIALNCHVDAPVWIEQECSIDQGSTVNDAAHDNDRGETRVESATASSLPNSHDLDICESSVMVLQNGGTRARYGRSWERVAPKKALDNGMANMVRDGDMAELDAPARPLLAPAEPR